MGFPAGLPAF